MPVGLSSFGAVGCSSRQGFATYREAAAIYRGARAKGISLTTIDTLIAAIALEHGTSIFTLDQDFSRIARITRLALYRF